MLLGEAVMVKQLSEGAVGKTQIKQTIKASYQSARTKYVEAAAQLVTALNGQGELRVILNHAEANMKGHEAQWVRDGLVIGKNAVERDAALAALRDEDADYQRLVHEAWDAKDSIIRLDADVERLKTEIRVYRYDMELAIGEMRVLAGEDSEPAYQR